MADATRFQKVLECTTTEVHEKQKGRINSMLDPEFIHCNAEDETVDIRFPVQQWQLNRGGNLHGGIIAAMFDLTFGALTRAAVDLNFVPTIELTTSFVRPIGADDSVIIKAKILYRGKKMTHLFGEAFVTSNGKKSAIGKGIFYNEDTTKNK